MKLPVSVFCLFLLAPGNLQAECPDSTQACNREEIKPSALIVPVSCIGASLVTFPENHVFDRYDVRDYIHREFPGFHTSVDDYLWAAPYAGMYLLKLTGTPGKNDLLNTTLLVIKSQILLEAILEPMKYTTRVMRPDSSERNSFPSGHTARAFAAATCFYLEFRDQSLWYGIGAYSVATSVGVLRMLNNRHWLSDVLMGAGIGILSTRIVYATHQYRWGKCPAVTLGLLPSPAGIKGCQVYCAVAL